MRPTVLRHKKVAAEIGRRGPTSEKRETCSVLYFKGGRKDKVPVCAGGGNQSSMKKTSLKEAMLLGATGKNQEGRSVVKREEGETEVRGGEG